MLRKHCIRKSDTKLRPYFGDKHEYNTRKRYDFNLYLRQKVTAETCEAIKSGNCDDLP